MLIFTILPLGAIAPIGTTMMGILAISDIRHSKGRLTGLPLAVTDSMLYPLLLLDGLIVCLFWLLCTIGYEIFGPGTPMSPRAEWLCVAITMLLSFPVCAYLDFRIVRAVWRKSCEAPSVSCTCEHTGFPTDLTRALGTRSITPDASDPAVHPGGPCRA